MGIDETSYMQGRQSVLGDLLRMCVNEMPGGDAERWRIERAEVVAKLRNICGVFGDNDWSDTLSLADVLDKHLLPYLADPGDFDPEDGYGKDPLEEDDPGEDDERPY